MSSWLRQLSASLANNENTILELETGCTKSYAELWENSGKVSRYLSGFDKEVVTVILPNSIQYVEVCLGTFRSRNVFNPIPYFVEVGELKKILGYATPKVVITDREDIKESFSSDYAVIHPKELLENQKNTDEKNVADEDIASLYYSSGTTGSPKGVLYSHENIFELIASINRGFKFTKNTKHLTFLPFGHTASINYNIFPCLFLGAPLVISKGFEHLRDKFFAVIADNKINYTQTVPTVLFMLLKLKHKVDALDLSSLPFIGCGSSTLPAEIQHKFYETYGLKVANLYGLSETGPSHIDDPREERWQAGTIGYALDVNQCRISEKGEVQLKGKNVFVGYYKNEKLYREVVQDGWFNTGDLAKFENGKYYFEDRKKDLIIKSGINILPSEIEEVIYKCDLVKECVVVGKPHQIHGEVVAAAIVSKKELPEKELIQQVKEVCKKNLSNYKVPSFIEIMNDIPKTHSGKLLRKRIREQFSS